MRETKWVDCPACGAKKSMRTRKGLHEIIRIQGYSPLDITGLDGQFCSSCGEGFWSLASERAIARRIAEHKASEDAVRVVAADLISVKEAAHAMRVSVQGVHKMMVEGRLRFVWAGGRRLPIREGVAERATRGRSESVSAGKP